MKALKLFFLYIILTSSACAGQDTTRIAHSKIGLVIGLDSRHSFVGNTFKNPIYILGAQVGVRYHRFKYWMGFYMTSSKTKVTVVDPIGIQKKEKVYRDVHLYFASVCAEYIFLNHKYMELTIPLEIGIGQSMTAYYTLTDQLMRNRRALFLPIQVGITVLLKPTRWVGLNGKIGYRETLQFSDFKGDYDGIYYSYGISLFLGTIYKDIQSKWCKKK